MRARPSPERVTRGRIKRRWNVLVLAPLLNWDGHLDDVQGTTRSMVMDGDGRACFVAVEGRMCIGQAQSCKGVGDLPHRGMIGAANWQLVAGELTVVHHWQFCVLRAHVA